MRKDRPSMVNIPMCIALALLCLTLVTSHLTSGLYARYVAQDESFDSARVIKFGDITLIEDGDFFEKGKLRIIPGENLQKRAVISFAGSEAATYVFVEITVSSDWTVTDDGRTFYVAKNNETLMSWSVDERWGCLIRDNLTHTYVYYYKHDGGEILPPNSSLVNVDIIANNGTITVSENITREQISTMNNITMGIRASVVQAGGFDNISEAWNSIASKEP